MVVCTFPVPVEDKPSTAPIRSVEPLDAVKVPAPEITIPSGIVSVTPDATDIVLVPANVNEVPAKVIPPVPALVMVKFPAGLKVPLPLAVIVCATVWLGQFQTTFPKG